MSDITKTNCSKCGNEIVTANNDPLCYVCRFKPNILPFKLRQPQVYENEYMRNFSRINAEFGNLEVE